MPFRPSQKSFRARLDSVGLNTNTFTYNLNANFSIQPGTTFRIRFCIQEVGATDGTATYHLRYSKNSAGYAGPITNATAQVKIVDTSQYTDLDATTVLLDGTGAFVAGVGLDSSTYSGNIALLASNNTEIEFCLQLVEADVANGDTFAFSVYRATSTAMYSYTNIPTVTVIKNINVSLPSQAAKTSEEVTAEVVAQTPLDVSVSDNAKMTEESTVSVQEAVLEDLSVQVSQSARVIDYISPPLQQSAGITEVLSAAVAAQTTLEISNIIETVKATEDWAVTVESPVTLEASISQAAELTEELVAEAPEPTIEPVNVSTPEQTAKATEDLVAEVVAQTTLAPSVEQSAKLSEELGVQVATQVVLAPSITDSAKITEDESVNISAQPVVEANFIDSFHLTEDLGVAVASPVTLEINGIDTVKLTEARAVTVEGLVADLEIAVAEVIKATEESAVNVIVQVTLELAAIDSVLMSEVVEGAISAQVTREISVADYAKLSEVLGLTVGEEVAPTANRKFICIPPKYFLAGSFALLPDAPIFTADPILVIPEEEE